MSQYEKMTKIFSYFGQMTEISQWKKSSCETRQTVDFSRDIQKYFSREASGGEISISFFPLKTKKTTKNV